MSEATNMFDRLAQQREKGKAAPEVEPKKRSRKATGKRSDPNYIQVGAYIPIELNKSVKRLLVDDDKDFSDLISELLEQWVRSNNA